MNKVKWIVQTQRGDIEGPLSQKQVLEKILQGVYLGEEWVSEYPSDIWTPISHHTEFFDAFLQTLGSQGAKNLLSTKSSHFVNKSTNERERKKEKKSKMGKAIPEAQDPSLLIDISAKIPQESKSSSTAQGGNPSSPKDGSNKNQPKNREKKGNDFYKVFSLAVLVLALALGLFLYQAQWSHKKNFSQSTGEIQLRAPKTQLNQKISPAQYQKQISQAIYHFSKDNLRSYLKAQDRLVKIVETTNRPEAYSFLCMTYLQLLEMTLRNRQAYNTVEKVLARIQALHPTHQSAKDCYAVFKWVQGDYEEVLRIINGHLAQDPKLLFFNQIIADIHASRKDYTSASYHLNQSDKIWPFKTPWSRTLLQKARMYEKRKLFSRAAKTYRFLVKKNKDHAVALLELGILEFKVFQKAKQAKKYIEQALHSKDFVPISVKAKAYVALAQMELKEGEPGEALKKAQKAFKLDSSNGLARQIILDLGGMKALNSMSVNSSNTVHLGEEYMKLGDYTAAQAEFRVAFEVNKKNSFSAFRASQALWKLHQGSEAIKWAQKALKSDPYFVQNYMILSHYLSASYKFLEAEDILKQAFVRNGPHYGIYRSLAQVSLLRKNSKKAIRYAQKALSLYGNDIDSLVLLAEAHLLNNEPDKSVQFCEQAIELDAGNEWAHSTMGHVLTKLQGAEAGISYIKGLIRRFDRVSFYKTLGQILTQEQRFDEAQKAYYEVLSRDSVNKEALIALGKILEEKKDFIGARNYFLEAAQVDPSDPTPFFLKGHLYLASRSPASKALKTFEKVLSINNRYPLAHYSAGLALMKMNDYRQAIKMSEKEKGINPQIPDPYLLAAEAHRHLRQYSLCAEEYQKALARGGESAQSYIHLARCYRLSGDLEGAFSALDKAKLKESGNPDIYKEQGVLYYMFSDYLKSTTAFRKYLELNPEAEDRKKIEAQIRNNEAFGK